MAFSAIFCAGVGEAQMPPIDNSLCLEDAGGTAGCTANDLQIVAVGVEEAQDDGCTGPGDDVDALVTIDVRSNTGNQRYDIGFFVAQDGGDAISAGGICDHFVLESTVSSPVGVGQAVCDPDDPLFDPANNTCDLTNGDGPFRDIDGDFGATCGDLLKSDGPIRLRFPLTIPCADSAPPDGFLDFALAATWKAGQGASCLSPPNPIDGNQYAINDQSSKCKAEPQTDSLIPFPDMTLTCSCFPTFVDLGETTSCTLAYDNTPDLSGNVGCESDPSKLEADRCGHGAFYQFSLDYDAAVGDAAITGLAGVDGNNQPFSGGAATDDDIGGAIVWTPESSVSTADGIIPPQDTATLSFDYTLSQILPPGVSDVQLDFVGTFHPTLADLLAGTNGVDQLTLTGACSLRAPTYTSIESFEAWLDRGRVVVEWQTVGEVATSAFVVERLDARSGSYRRVGQVHETSPSQAGATYRLADEGASPGGVHSYRLIEIERNGLEHSYGPFEVVPRVAAAPLLSAAVTSTVLPRLAASSDRSSALLQEKRVTSIVLGGRSTHRSAAGSPVDSARLELSETALYYVSASELATGLGRAESSLMNSILRGQLAFFEQETPVSWQRAAGDQGIYVVGKPFTSLYASQNVFLLTLEAGPTMGSISGQAPPTGPTTSFFDTLHAEEELLLGSSVATDPEQDYWFWQTLFATDPDQQRATLLVEVPGVSLATTQAELAVEIWNFEGTPQAAEVAINGVAVGTLDWSESGPASAQIEFSQSLLASGSNEIEIVATVGRFFLDSLDLTYERLHRASGDTIVLASGDAAVVTVDGFSGLDIAVFDLEDPNRPLELSDLTVAWNGTSYGASWVPSAPGSRYLATRREAALPVVSLRGFASNSLRRSTHHADYLIVAPEILLDGAEALAGLRQTDGLDTFVAPLEAVINEFGDGIYHPDAIRGFFEYAYEQWRVAPRMAVVLGTGHLDFQDRLGFGGNLIPPLMATIGNAIAASDSQLGDFDGDGLPEMLVARIPVATPLELDDYLQKLQSYDPADAGWAGKALLIADDADSAGNFMLDSRRQANLLSWTGFDTDSVDLGSGSGELERAAVLSAISEGRALVHYAGHGGVQRWADEGLLRLADVAALDNQQRLPFVLALTCLSNAYHFPGTPSLGPSLIAGAEHGAVAILSATGVQQNGPAAQLGAQLVRSLYGSERQQFLGLGLLAGMEAYVDAGGGGAYLPAYTLLGDPGLLLALPGD